MMKPYFSNEIKVFVHSIIWIGLVAAVFLLFSLNVEAEKPKITFEHFTPDQGMSSYITPCMIQDKAGYLWFGTYNGLDRYDGNTFTSYVHEPENPTSINSGSDQAICEDKDGNIWVGTSLGLDKLNPSTGHFSHFLLHSSGIGIDFSNYILSVCEDEFDTLWIGTGDGLNLFNRTSGKYTTFKYDSLDSGSLSNNYVHALLKDKEGRLWIGTGNGLDELDKKTGKFIHYWHDPKNRQGSVRIEWDNSIEYSLTYQINSIYEDNKGMIWLCTNGEGLIEVNPKSGLYKTYKHDPKDPESLISLTDDNIEAINQDHDGIYWIGTKYNGLNTFNPKTNEYTHFHHDNYNPGSLSIDMILSICCERSGTIWITSFNGINKINRKKLPFRQYNDIENSWDKSFGTGENIINGSEGKLWVQTESGMMLKFDPGTDTFTPQFNTYKTGRNYIAKDNLGNIWITSYAGGIYVKGKNGQVSRINYSSGKEFSQHVYCIDAPPSNDTVWVGTLEGGIFYIYKPAKAISLIKSFNTSIKCIYKDTSGSLWAGTKDAGLIQYNVPQNKFVLFKSDVNDPGSISGNLITVIYKDKKGNVWFGTNIGLNKYLPSTNSYIHFTEKEGLPSNLIFAIEEDIHGNLWLSTDNGISKLNPENGAIKNYDITYGFASNRFYFRSCKTENGEIYFAGPGGLTRFNPDSIIDNSYVPPIVITSFRIFDKPVPFGKEIKLTYDKNSLSFEFAALSYVSPERNLYAYKMAGVDKDWVYSGKRHYASYPDMIPGKYTFRVKGSNNDAVWNEEGTSVSIIISPPWWKSKMAYTGYGMFVLFTLFFLRRYELKRVEMRDKIILDETMLKEREDLDTMKSRFFANISHEFRTPLTLILGPAEKINLKVSDESVKKDSRTIIKNSKRLLQLVNQLLDLSKLEAGKLKMNASKGNIVSFIKGVVQSYESFLEEKDITLKISAEKEFIELYFDREMMLKIVSNILSNAFKFTPQNGKITISLNEIDNYVLIKIRDTGIGIPHEEIPKLFDRFYQVDSSFTKEYEGTGIGLALTKELLTLHHGTISVESEKDKGTAFTLKFPMGRNHFEDVEISVEEIEDNLKTVVNNGSQFISENVRSEIIDDSTGNSSDHGKTIILVVEDNSDMRDYIKESLGGDYHIEEAVNGEQGVRKAENLIPDLIISDVMMPRMNGNELVRILKNDEKTSHIPIIILTAKSEKENKFEGLRKGADDYLTKPFDIEELRIRIDNLIKIRRSLQINFSREISEPETGEKKIRNMDEKFLNKVLKIVEEYISDEKFSIEDLGNKIGMSRSQIHRKISALTGKSPSVYVRSIRLYKAKKLLENGEGNISEIAYSVGFSSPVYFSKCFKEEFGHPPKNHMG